MVVAFEGRDQRQRLTGSVSGTGPDDGKGRRKPAPVDVVRKGSEPLGRATPARYLGHSTVSDALSTLATSMSTVRR